MILNSNLTASCQLTLHGKWLLTLDTGKLTNELKKKKIDISKANLETFQDGQDQFLPRFVKMLVHHFDSKRDDSYVKLFEEGYIFCFLGCMENPHD